MDASIRPLPPKPAVETEQTRLAGVTLRRLQIFWSVAHAPSLTRAAKQLGMAQPSLSQQISSLETAVGAVLFERRSNAMSLTPEGEALLRLAERVLVAMQALEDGIAEIAGKGRTTLRIGGVNSVLRVLLPPALGLMPEGLELDFDLHDAAPAEVLELLYGRRISVGLLAAGSISDMSSGFRQVALAEDPYVLAVPDAPLPPGPEAAGVLNNVIQFTFGTRHTERDQAWFDDLLPRNRCLARVRSYETALGMVAQGLGCCLLPAMSVPAQGVAGVRLHQAGLPPRRIVALVPAQNLRLPAHAALIAALEQAGRSYAPPPIAPPLPWMRHP